jgi:hypothetical protein
MKKRKTRQKSAMLNTPSQGKKLLRELRRKEHLQNDEYILSFTEITATCAACMMEFQLDNGMERGITQGFGRNTDGVAKKLKRG